MTVLTPAEQMLYSATKLTTYKGDQPTGSGTGFFYDVVLGEDRHVQLLVTNKHVLEGNDRVDISLHIGNGENPPGPSGRFHSWQVEFVGSLISHPDPNVDLCCLPIGGLLQEAHANGLRPFFVQFTKDTVPTDDQWAEFDAIEQVSMIGCPRGLFDTANNLAVSRRGITASHLSKRFQGREEFLVDLACFPGSSGSPVFLYDSSAQFDRSSGNFVLGGIRMFLLGILYAGPTITNEGRIVLNQQPTIQIATMMHLGQVIRSSALLEFDRLVLERHG